MILDRNGGKFSYKWLGPYVVENISKKSLFTLCNQSDVELSKKYNERPDLQNLEGVLEKEGNSSALCHVDTQTDISSHMCGVNWRMKSSKRFLYCLYEIQMKLHSPSINCLSPASLHLLPCTAFVISIGKVLKVVLLILL